MNITDLKTSLRNRKILIFENQMVLPNKSDMEWLEVNHFVLLTELINHFAFIDYSNI
jgi:hypothetical protein